MSLSATPSALGGVVHFKLCRFNGSTGFLACARGQERLRRLKAKICKTRLADGNFPFSLNTARKAQADAMLSINEYMTKTFFKQTFSREKGYHQTSNPGNGNKVMELKKLAITGF